MMATIGDRIKQKRKEQRLSAEDLAVKLGLKKENIYKWERGSKPSDPDDLALVNKWLNESSSVPQNLEQTPAELLMAKEIIDELRKDKEFLQRALEGSLKSIGVSLDAVKDMLLNARQTPAQSPVMDPDEFSPPGRTVETKTPQRKQGK